jgi:pyrimidine operon attenuation protein/uracil phosphoribosyltransferase
MSVADERNTLLDARDIQRALQRMAKEVVDFAGGTDRLVLVGIQRRGVDLAERLGAILGTTAPKGQLDITLYRDDLETIGPAPVVGKTDLPMELTERCVMIVDDVLYTGRTIRAALSVLSDFGRPSRIGLCVLIDRGGRELPIQADIVGETVDAKHRDRVDVLLEERDGEDAVVLVPREEE